MNKIFKAFCSCLMVCGFAMTLTNCSDNDDPTFLSEVQLSQSYVAIPQTGGSTTIKVNVSTNWSISNIPEWLTISPASGSAGENQITSLPMLLPMVVAVRS